MEWKNDPSKELRLTEVVLSGDQKNYHAWQHRQWAIQTFGLFDDELQYTENLLLQDVRNNSAWNERFFVITCPKNKNLLPKGGGGPVLKDPMLSDELCLVQEAIEGVPENESAWNYLRGLQDHADESVAPAFRRKVMEFCQTLFDNKVRSIYLLGFMIDQFRDQGGEDNLKKAEELCHDLATKHDVIRKEYWLYISSQLSNE